jgi:hypothetical protein
MLELKKGELICKILKLDFWITLYIETLINDSLKIQEPLQVIQFLKFMKELKNDIQIKLLLFVVLIFQHSIQNFHQLIYLKSKLKLLKTHHEQMMFWHKI